MAPARALEDSRKGRPGGTHELAAEGFISESYRWFAGSGMGEWLGVRWLVDASWVKMHEANTARARSLVLRLVGGAALLWLGIMLVLVLR